MSSHQYENNLAIVGAGIGGVTFALALQRMGLPFSIYDKAEAFDAVGYGIQLSPNAVRVLHALGLQSELADIANVCQRMVMRDLQTDKLLLSWPIHYDVPYYQCLRSDLHAMLYQALGNGVIHYASNIGRAEDLAENYIVAADGVHSNIRAALYPGYQGQYSGYIAYRVLVPYEVRFAELQNTTTVWLSDDQHVVVYPAGKDNMINIVLIAKQRNMLGESWIQEADNDDIMQRFLQKKQGLLYHLLVCLQQQQTQSYCWGLFDYRPLPNWYQNQQVLLGDAAHPMLPFMAQGAAMAIEDAWVLSQQLKRADSFQRACENYQRLRFKRASKVQKISRKNADIFHAGGLIKLSRDNIFKAIQIVQPQLMRYKLDWLYKYNALDVV